MEQKKLDLNSIIGFALIFGIFIWMMFGNKPSEQEIAAEKAKKEQVAKAKVANEVVADKPAELITANDSVRLQELKGTLGTFAYSATLPSATSGVTTLENELIKLSIANKGGYIVEATLKNFEKSHKGSFA